MALKDDIALLKQLPIFADLSEDHLRLLAFGAERRRLEPGHVLFREGASGDSAFVVTSGRLKLSRHSAPGRELSVGEAGPGTILSEIAMIAEAERHFTATSLEDCEVIRISRTLFRRMLEEYPEVAQATERRLRDNFAGLVGNIARLAGSFR
jgi:CRP-like cAMP-binding protein